MAPLWYANSLTHLQLAVFLGCLYAASWFALCSNGHVTSHPTCFSLGEQWQPVVNTKATHLHHPTQTLSESISTWQWQWCSQNTSPYTFPKCTMHYITFTLHYVVLRYVTLRYIMLRCMKHLFLTEECNDVSCTVATCNFVPFMGGCCMVIEHQLYLTMAEQMTCALARVYLWALDCVKSQRRVWSLWSHMQSLK